MLRLLQVLLLLGVAISRGLKMPTECLESPKPSYIVPPWVNSGSNPIALVLFGSVGYTKHQARSMRGLPPQGLNASLPIGPVSRSYDVNLLLPSRGAVDIFLFSWAPEEEQQNELLQLYHDPVAHRFENQSQWLSRFEWATRVSEGNHAYHPNWKFGDEEAGSVLHGRRTRKTWQRSKSKSKDISTTDKYVGALQNRCSKVYAFNSCWNSASPAELSMWWSIHLALDLMYSHERARPEGRYERVFLARPDVLLNEAIDPLALAVGKGVYHNSGNQNSGDMVFGLSSEAAANMACMPFHPIADFAYLHAHHPDALKRIVPYLTGVDLLEGLPGYRAAKHGGVRGKRLMVDGVSIWPLRKKLPPCDGTYDLRVRAACNRNALSEDKRCKALRVNGVRNAEDESNREETEKGFIRFYLSDQTQKASVPPILSEAQEQEQRQKTANAKQINTGGSDLTQSLLSGLPNRSSAIAQASPTPSPMVMPSTSSFLPPTQKFIADYRDILERGNNQRIHELLEVSTPPPFINASFSSASAATIVDHCAMLMDHMDAFHRENPMKYRGGSLGDYLLKADVRNVEDTANITRAVLGILTGPELPPEPHASALFSSATTVPSTPSGAPSILGRAPSSDESHVLGSLVRQEHGNQSTSARVALHNHSHYNHSHLRVAVCMTGNLRTVADFQERASTSFMKNFWRPGYDVFLVVGDALSSKSRISGYVTSAQLRNSSLGGVLRSLNVVSIGEIKLDGDPRDPFGQVRCRHFDPPRLNHIAMIGQFMKFPLAYNAMIKEEIQQGFTYEFVIRARPDLVFIHEFPRLDHFFEGHRTYHPKVDKRGAFGGPFKELNYESNEHNLKADVVTFDDQFAIMTRHAADGFFNGVPQAYLECQDHKTWAKACGVTSEQALGLIKVTRVPCAPVRLFAPLQNLTVRECGDLKLKSEPGRPACNKIGCSCFRKQHITTSHW